MSAVRSLVWILLAMAAAVRPASSETSFTVETHGKGSPVVFLPCLGCPGAVWDDVIAVLSEHHTCHVLSFRAFGPSGKGHAFDPERAADEVAEYFASRHLKKAVLVGHSFGGVLALRISAAHPKLFEKLVIVDAQPFPMAFARPDMTPEIARQQAAALRAIMLEQSDEDFRRQQTMMLGSAVPDSSLRHQIVDWQARSDRAAVAASYGHVLSADLREEIGSIRAETLVLGTWIAARPLGMSRDTVLDHFKEQYAKLPRCTIAIAEDAGHFVMYDDLEWLLEQLVAFID